MYKIMVVEDDLELSTLVKDGLVKYNYVVFEPTDFNRIEEQFEEIQPDLVLLDINLPYYDGFYLCKAMRRKSKCPIIIVSARSGEIDQVMAMELGADDYLTKPFTMEILLAKVRATLRRVYGEYSNLEKNLLNINSLSIDENSLKMSYQNKVVELSKNEYKLIKKFIENRERIITREELFEDLWDTSTFVDENTLTVNISRVKSKFQAIGIENIIKNKRGIGYIFDEQVLDGEKYE